jgi:hypothetical protein
MIGAAAQMALGVVPSLITTGMNIGQLVGAKKAQEEARKKFDAGVQDVKNQMLRNVQEERRVQDESTRLKYMQDLAALQQATDTATSGGQRTTLAALPGLQAASQAASEQGRLGLQKREDERTGKIVDQEEVLRKERKDLSEELAAIAFAQEQQATKDYNKLLGETLTGLGGTLTQGIKSAPLFMKNLETSRAQRLVDALPDDQLGGLSREQALDAIMAKKYDRRTLRDARKMGFVPDETLFSDYAAKIYGSGLPKNVFSPAPVNIPMEQRAEMALGNQTGLVDLLPQNQIRTLDPDSQYRMSSLFPTGSFLAPQYQINPDG